MKYGRRGVSALLALILAAGSGLPVSAAELKVSSDQTQITKGSDITLTLTMDEDVSDVICLDYRVYFDENSFSLKEGTVGSANEDIQISEKPMMYGSDKRTCYSVNLVDKTTNGTEVKAGELCELTFTAQKDMTGEWQDAFQVERVHFATTDYWTTSKETDEGKVSYEVASSVVYGDVNGDGKINTADAAITYASVNKKITLKEEQLKAADVNGDGKVNAADAAIIYAYVNKKIAQFPVEKQQ